VKKAKMRMTPEVKARMKAARRAQILLRLEEKKKNPGAKAWRGKRHREQRFSGAGSRHGRTMKFFNSAAWRLSWEDYEKVSVATICRNARSTPYTFYKRFPSRPAFEYALVRVTFLEMTRGFGRELAPEAWKDATPQAIIFRLVDKVIANTMSVPTIGVIQLAMRIRMSKPKGAEPYIQFRSAVIDRAVELMSPKLEIPNAKESVRNAIQMLFAMANDEAWRSGIPIQTERKRELAGIYSNLIFRCLGLPPGKRDSKDFGTDEPYASGLPEQLQITYGITKYHLYEYARDVKASKRPEFRADTVEDAIILMTRKESLRTEHPRKPRKRIARML